MGGGSKVFDQAPSSGEAHRCYQKNPQLEPNGTIWGFCTGFFLYFFWYIPGVFWVCLRGFLVYSGSFLVCLSGFLAYSGGFYRTIWVFLYNFGGGVLVQLGGFYGTIHLGFFSTFRWIFLGCFLGAFLIPRESQSAVGAQGVR